MSADARTVTVKLLDKEYTISCPDGAEAELLASADYLNQKMQDIRQSGKIIGLERIAVMAALNMSHELIKSREEQRQNIETNLRRLGQKIDQGLARTPPSRAHENSSTS
ncbi:cell division protein ZapA [Marinobacterium sediminicola]|uniref:Cell division protein ZapA n=1 Tax=Marinobacterium sediminicola TaxID=518898 RepID=A0ABY1RZA0_9GAMM|nr:cell division protein ZapA [Marinobacterium sediminicola]ULG69064.1 cell division protein ZapA [Marinobacterium sediminicola]SMR73673.1 cell division protein ZapA [Marinobacterium sediminicola]